MKKALLVLALLGTAGYTAYKVTRSPVATTDGASLALDRIWLDHLPVSETDTVQVFVAITEQPFGVFQQASMWRGAHELFQYERDGGKLRISYPQTGEKESAKLTATRCNERGMDFCLEIAGASRGVKRYYSQKGWEIDGMKSLGQLQPRIDALLEPVN